jgi:hypothetical protein
MIPRSLEHCVLSTLMLTQRFADVKRRRLVVTLARPRNASTRSCSARGAGHRVCRSPAASSRVWCTFGAWTTGFVIADRIQAGAAVVVVGAGLMGAEVAASRR